MKGNISVVQQCIAASITLAHQIAAFFNQITEDEESENESNAEEERRNVLFTLTQLFGIVHVYALYSGVLEWNL